MNRKGFFCVFLFVCSLFYFNACGMDVVYYLKGPETTYNAPSVTSSTYTSQTSYETAYFSFKTEEDGNDEFIGGSATLQFQGTAIYYKIYNNYTTMNSDISSISSKSSSTNESAAATYIIETRKFVQLGTDSSSTPMPLISATGNDRKVYIRLTNHKEKEFRARILVGGDCENGAITYDRNGAQVTEEIGVPMRYGNELNFDFGKKYESGSHSGNYVRPEDGDDDVYYTSSASQEGMWYVVLYAIGVGRDESFSNQYSNVLYLGALAIDANEEYN